MRLSSSKVKERVKIINKRYKDNNYLKEVENKEPKQYESIYWSKNLAYSIAPLTLEFVGISPSKFVSKKPIKKDFDEHYLIGDDIFKILSFRDNVINRIRYIIFEKDLKISVSVKNNKIDDITEVYYENNIAISSLRVNEKGYFWYDEYFYEGLKIKQVLSEQAGFGRGISYVEYIDNIVNRIYDIRQGVKYYHYRRR